jgi:uncharacterized protein (TIGR03000 family)
MLRQRFAAGLLAAALLSPAPAGAQYFPGDRATPMSVGRSSVESYGPGYTVYTPSASLAGRYDFYPGKYTGDYRATRFATSNGYYATMSSGYSPIMMTSLNYPEVYGSYILGAGPLINAAPVFQTRPDNPPSDNPVGAPYAPLSRPLADVPLHREVALTARPAPVTATATARPALIDVVLPADAALSFQGVPMTEETGALRQFQSPPLTPGRNYSYDVRATWKDKEGREIVRSRRLTVRAGDHLDVDLTRATMPPADEVEETRPQLRTEPLPLRDLRRVPRE